MIYKEAQDLSLKVKWKVQECSTKNCWCAWIAPVKSIGYIANNIEEELDCIVPQGNITKEIAQYIVDLHNQTIKETKHTTFLEELKDYLKNNPE